MKTMLVNVQFLRFVAATMVLLYHAAQGIGKELGIDNPLRNVFMLIGFSGVDLFFVISGFIIYASNQNNTGSNQAVQFISLRTARIFLGYWPFFFIAWGMLYYLNEEKLEKINLVSSFFLIPDKVHATLINVTWSLSYELYFYGLFFVLFFLKNRLRIIMIAAATIIVFNVFANYVFEAYTWKGFNNISSTIRFIASPWLLEFFAGCVVAHMIGKGTKAGAWLSVTAGITLFALGYLLNATVIDGKMDKFFNCHYRMCVFGIGSALLIYGLVNLEQRGFVIFSRFSMLLGGASYSLYLCHAIILDAIAYSTLQQSLINLALPPTLKYIALLLVIQVVAVLLYLGVEKPVYTRSKQWIYAMNAQRKAAV